MRNKKHFYITMNFYPNYKKMFTKLDDVVYKNNKTGEKYEKRLMFDWGWGQENGFQLLPQLSFQELLYLIVNYKKSILYYNTNYMNLIGSVSIIMQDYTEQLIDFMMDKISTNYFDNKRIRENFKWFCFDSKQAGTKGGIGTKSYEAILCEYPIWNSISDIVKKKIYIDKD